MNFSRAITYPFANLAKVVSIVLAMTIAIAIFLGLIANTYDWSPLVAMLYGVDLGIAASPEMPPFTWSAWFGLLGLLIVAVVSGFWFSGYSMEAVRSVMSGIDTLPDVKFSRNMKDGFYLFISSVAYWILLAAVLLVLFAFLGLTGSADGLNLIVALASLIVGVVAVALLGWAYFIGMARFAAEGDHKASWQVFRNIRLAREHWRGGFTLLLYMIALTLIYGVVRSLVDSALGGFIGGFGMVSITLSIIVYYIFNLMQHFSTQHLVAQYAIQIGLADEDYNQEKPKLDFI